MAELNFEFTCPTINTNISHITLRMQNDILAFLEQFNITFISQQAVLDLVMQMYKRSIEPGIENIRDTNTQMREAAEMQLDEYEKVISCLEEQLQELIPTAEVVEVQQHGIKEIDILDTFFHR